MHVDFSAASVRRGLWVLSVYAALGCGSSSRSSAIQITAPEKGSVLTSADDLDDDTPGLQYTVKASSSGIAAGTEVLLQIEDEAQATLSKIGRNGDIVFDRVTLPSGTHSLTVSTKAGNVRSPGDWDYTYKAVVIDNPRDGALIGYLEDEDKDQSNGIQIMVSVSTYGFALSDDVKLQVDGQDFGMAQRPNANGKLVFHEVPLEGGNHELLVTAGTIESKPAKVTVAKTCATATFVSPEPSADGSEVVVGGGDTCPKADEQFKTNFTIATDAGENRSVDLIVNDMVVATEHVKDSIVKFTDIVLDRYNTTNQVAVRPQSAQGVTCKDIAYPGGIRLGCEGVDCSIDVPKPQSGVDATGKSVLYLNGSSLGKDSDGFDFEVLTESGSVGQPAKLVIDGDTNAALMADPQSNDSRVVATFHGVKLTDGAHTIQAICENKLGRRGLSRKVSWLVDTKACGVDIREPSAGATFDNSHDSESSRTGIQVMLQSSVDADDCTLARAAPCEADSGIDSEVGFESFGGGSELTSIVTLLDEATQTLCVEVKDRAGNVGRDTVDVKYRDATSSGDPSKPLIETPKDGDSYNAKGTSKYKPDSDPKSADCNANFDVACSALNVDVQLRRDNAQGKVLATAKCQAKGEGDPALPNGYARRARFKNVAFLSNGSETAKVVATQTVGSGSPKVSAAITLNGDCQVPALNFTSDMGDPCQGGQLGVASASDSVTKRVVATDTTGDSNAATLTLTSGGSVVSTKSAALSNGSYTFDAVAFGSPGASGKRSVTLKVTAKDGFENQGERSCDTNVVYDVPTLTVTEPVDNLMLTPDSDELCKLSGSTTPGVTVTASTEDPAADRRAVAHFDQGADIPLTRNGNEFSGCIPVQNGTHKLVVRLISTKTTARTDVTRTVTSTGLSVGLSISGVEQPSDNRKGSVRISWAAPNAGQYTGYQLRCAPTPLEVATASTADSNTWWTSARVQPLPDGFAPPSNSLELRLRVGESNQCVLRGVGAADALSPLVSSTDVTLLFHNHRFHPTSTGQAAGQDLAAVGDVNGDGIDDLLAGGQGEAYLVFGSRTGFSRDTPDVVFKGPDASYFGNLVAGLGDFNGDGRNDFAIADFTWASRAGRVLVYYGRARDNAWPDTVDAATSCSADLCFVSDVSNEQFGFALAGAGDFDADGKPDLFVGAPAIRDAGFGAVYVISGRAYTSGAPSGAFFGASVTVKNVARGFVVKGTAETAGLGTSGAGIGNLDGSEGTDLVVSALGCRRSDCMTLYNLDQDVMGKAFLFSGRPYPSSASGLVSLGISDFGFRGAMGAPSGSAFVEADAGRYGAAVFALGNVYDLPSANRPGVTDVAIWRQNDTGFDIYLGDTNFAVEDRLRVGVASAQASNFSVANGSAHSDLDGDGLVDMCAADENAARSDPARLWYGDVIKGKLAGKNLDAQTGSPLSPQLTTGGIIEFVGDLNGDGAPDLAVGAPTINPDASMYGQGEFQILY